MHSEDDSGTAVSGLRVGVFKSTVLRSGIATAIVPLTAAGCCARVVLSAMGEVIPKIASTSARVFRLKFVLPFT